MVVIRPFPCRIANFKQVVHYVLEKEQDNAEIRIRHNLKGDDPAGWIRQFHEIENQRIKNRKNSVRLNHYVISFHPGDTDAIEELIAVGKNPLQELAQEFIDQYCPTTAALVVFHKPDKIFPNLHVHLVFPGVTMLGRSLRVSKSVYESVRVHIQKTQEDRFPELTHSLVDHTKANPERITTKEYRARTKGKLMEKDRLRDILLDCFKDSKTLETFLEILQSKEIEPYYRNGRLQGVRYGKRKYRFKRLGLSNELERLLGEREVEREFIR